MTSPDTEGSVRGPLLAFAGVMLFSAFVLWGDLDWCIQGHPAFSHSIHSDEDRKVASVMNMRLSVEGTRPDRFLLAKGTLLPTLGRLLYEAVDRTPLSHAFAWLYGVAHDSRAGTYLLLRSLSALCALALTGLVFRTTWLLSGQPWSGVIAAFLVATTFGGAFSAVIFKSDMLLTTLVGGLLLSALHYERQPTAARAALMGGVLGVAVAAKYIAILAAVVPVATWGLLPDRGRRLPHLGAAALGCLGALFVSAPWLFFLPRELLSALEYQMQMQSTRSHHFEGFGFQPAAVVTHLLEPSLGSAFTALALAGSGYAAWLCAWRRQWTRYLPLLAYVSVQMVALSLSSWLVVRYTLPLYPVVAAFAGILAWRMGVALARRESLAARAGLLVLALLGVAHGVRFLAFDRLLRDPTPTVQAAAWLRSHLPSGARVLEIRRRPPLVYGFGAQVERLVAVQVEQMIAKGERLSRIEVDYVVVTERSFRQYYRLRSVEYARQRAFFSELFDNRRFTLVRRFETPARAVGITFPKGFLPQDLVLAAPDTYVFEVVGTRAALSR